MKKHSFILFLSSLLWATNIFSANIDTAQTYSSSMNKEIPAIVITPNDYNKEAQLPVVYLLHGYSDEYSSWANRFDDAKRMSDQYNFIIVCPDGDYSSWYFDSPMDSTSRYETYIAKELVEWIDNNYKTIPNRNARAITGLSMGGHGALYLAFRNQEVFGACGSMSGGVDIRPFPENWEIKKHLGNQCEHPDNWEKNTVINMMHLLTPNKLAITIDCGIEDFFFDVNVRLHEELTYRNIPHTFISRPGTHSWDFWKMSVKYHALFFAEYFNQLSL